jgi:exosortase/archaeosortase family protein
VHSNSYMPEQPGLRRAAGPPGRHAAQASRGPSRRTSKPERERPPAQPASRAVAIGVLGGIAVSLVMFEYQFRHLEAEAAASIYRLFTPVLAASSAPILWFGLGGSHPYGLEITPDCSSALLIVPLCVLGMLLMIPRRLPIARVAKALGIAAVILVGGNLLRIGVIALTIRVSGMATGYPIGHLIIGSIISIVCIATSLALLTAIVSSQGNGLFRRHRRAVS